MTDKEQNKAFAGELDKLIERFAKEFEMTYVQIVGVLELKKHLLCSEAEESIDEL